MDLRRLTTYLHTSSPRGVRPSSQAGNFCAEALYTKKHWQTPINSRCAQPSYALPLNLNLFECSILAGFIYPLKVSCTIEVPRVNRQEYLFTCGVGIAVSHLDCIAELLDLISKLAAASLFTTNKLPVISCRPLHAACDSYGNWCIKFQTWKRSGPRSKLRRKWKEKVLKQNQSWPISCGEILLARLMETPYLCISNY